MENYLALRIRAEKVGASSGLLHTDNHLSLLLVALGAFRTRATSRERCQQDCGFKLNFLKRKEESLDSLQLSNTTCLEIYIEEIHTEGL